MHSRQDSSRISAYLERVESQLTRLPSDRRRQQVEELRQHLDALIAQYEEVGVLPGEGVEAAIGQLGDPARLGRWLLREWRLTERKAAGERHAPARYALKALVWTSLFSFWFCDPLLAHVHSAWFPSDFSLICFVPVIAGALTGWRWPERSLNAVFQAMMLLIVAFLGSVGLGFLISVELHGLLTGRSILTALFDDRTPLGTVEFFLMSCLRWLGIWLPLGLLAAYLGGMVKRGFSAPKRLRRM
jgi:uncharacterized membrane protein